MSTRTVAAAVLAASLAAGIAPAWAVTGMIPSPSGTSPTPTAAEEAGISRQQAEGMSLDRFGWLRSAASATTPTSPRRWGAAPTRS